MFESAMQKENKYECCIHFITKEKFLITNDVFFSMNSLHISNFSLQINEEQYYRPVICLTPNLSTHVLLCLRSCEETSCLRERANTLLLEINNQNKYPRMNTNVNKDPIYFILCNYDCSR
jgi:hypothetical protein